jgi:hypothetical protein
LKYVLPGDRKIALEEAMEQGHKFTAAVNDKLHWLALTLNKLASSEPISADKDALARQMQHHEACFLLMSALLLNVQC